MKRKKIIIGLLLLVLIIGVAGSVLLSLSRDNSKEKHESVKRTSKITKEKPKEVAKEQPASPSFNKSQYSTDDPVSIWVVANKTRPLQPKDYAPNDLIAVGGGQQLRKEAGDALGQLITGARTAGLTLRPLSGYRSYATQVSVYNNEVRSNGQAVADTQSARPGTSEHQTGLAIDVGGGGCGIEDCFGNTSEGKWLATNAYQYGFIIRYPEGKMGVTGYRYEPWHIRYVGTSLATEMKKQGVLTLEEFFGLPAAPSY